MDSSRGWQAGRGWLIHDSHDSLGGPLALVPASGRREAVSRLSHENLEVEIADSDSGLVQVWAHPSLGTWGDALGSSRTRFGFGSLGDVEDTVVLLVLCTGKPYDGAVGWGQKTCSNISCHSPDLSSTSLKCHLYRSILNLHVTCIFVWTWLFLFSSKLLKLLLLDRIFCSLMGQILPCLSPQSASSWLLHNVILLDAL